MQYGLEKLIKLAKKTGDRLIVFDSQNPEESFVLMGVNDYEKLVIQKSEVRGLTEDELLDKINRDIAIWKSEHDYGKNESNNDLENEIDRALNQEKSKQNEEDDRMYYYGEDEEDDDLYFKANTSEDELDDENDFEDDFLENSGRSNLWKIPKKIEKGAEEII